MASSQHNEGANIAPSIGVCPLGFKRNYWPLVAAPHPASALLRNIVALTRMFSVPETPKGATLVRISIQTRQTCGLDAPEYLPRIQDTS